MGVGTNAEVTLEGGLVEDPRVRRTSNGAALSGAAEDWVASFIPITVHGQLDTGETVTLLIAHSHGSDGEFFGLPRYRAHTVMFGSHVPSIDQLVTAVRFRAGHPYWLAHPQDGDTYRHDDGSTLSVEGADDGNWLVYTPPDPMRLRRLEITAVSGSLVLMELALDQTVVTRDTQVRIEADSPWIAVHGGGFSAPASDFRSGFVAATRRTDRRAVRAGRVGGRGVWRKGVAVGAALSSTDWDTDAYPLAPPRLAG